MWGSQPYLQVGQPVDPIGQPLLATSVLHRLKGQIYVIAQGRFDPRVQIHILLVRIKAPYIRPCTPSR